MSLSPLTVPVTVFDDGSHEVLTPRRSVARARAADRDRCPDRPRVRVG